MKEYSFPGEDCYGENSPTNVFYKEVFPYLESSNLSTEDFEQVIWGIMQMTEAAYDNGYAEAKHDFY